MVQCTRARRSVPAALKLHRCACKSPCRMDARLGGTTFPWHNNKVSVFYPVYKFPWSNVQGCNYAWGVHRKKIASCYSLLRYSCSRSKEKEETRAINSVAYRANFCRRLRGFDFDSFKAFREIKGMVYIFLEQFLAFRGQISFDIFLNFKNCFKLTRYVEVVIARM